MELSPFNGCTTRVEIAKGNMPKSIGSSVPGKHLFKRPLGGPVRIHRRPSCILSDRDRCWFAINGRCRRKHQPIHLGIDHRIKQIQYAMNIDVKKFCRISCWFSNQGLAGQMGHGVRSQIRNGTYEPVTITKVTTNELCLIGNCHPMPTNQAVQHNNRVAPAEKTLSDHAANVTRPTSHKYFHTEGRIMIRRRCRWNYAA